MGCGSGGVARKPSRRRFRAPPGRKPCREPADGWALSWASGESAVRTWQETASGAPGGATRASFRFAAGRSEACTNARLRQSALRCPHLFWVRKIPSRPCEGRNTGRARAVTTTGPMTPARNTPANCLRAFQDIANSADAREPRSPLRVMPANAGIHAFLPESQSKQDVDARIKSGHDD